MKRNLGMLALLLLLRSAPAPAGPSRSGAAGPMRAFLSAAVLLLGSVSVALADPSLSNVTVMTWDRGHGTQVEYFDARGRNWLWYPGNRIALPGRWKSENGNICFAYGRNTYNPQTGHRGGGYECTPAAVHERGVVDRVRGDVFNLKSGRIPFVLSPRKTTIRKLLSKVR